MLREPSETEQKKGKGAWKVGVQRWRGGTKSLAGKMAHKIGWSCFPKINGAELESLGAPNMEVLIAFFHFPSFAFFCDSAPCLYSFLCCFFPSFFLITR
jgi:hypothetical protein